jgi:hypothetical protein
MKRLKEFLLLCLLAVGGCKAEVYCPQGGIPVKTLNTRPYYVCVDSVAVVHQEKP